MIIGFSGTRRGMTESQKRVVREWLVHWRDKIEYVVHGDCYGADAEFDEIAKGLGIQVHIRPATANNGSVSNTMRAHCEGAVVHHPRMPLDRNHDIVDEADVMLISPRESEPVLRSGTWATFRYAQKVDKDTIRITPNGEMWCSSDPNCWPRQRGTASLQKQMQDAFGPVLEVRNCVNCNRTSADDEWHGSNVCPLCGIDNDTVLLPEQEEMDDNS